MRSRANLPRCLFTSVLVALLAATGCQRAAPPAPETAPAPKVAAADLENGAISVAPVSERAAPVPKDPRTAWIDWKPTTLSSGQVWLSCSLDYTQGDGAT